MDELDLLIEDALGSDDEQPIEADEATTPEDTDATVDPAEVEIEVDDEAVADSEEGDSQDDSLPEGTPDGTEETPAEVASTPDSQVASLQAQIQRQQDFIKSVFEEAKAEQERQEAERRQAEQESEYQKRLAEWEEMDPDDARREQVAYIAQMAEERDKALQAEISQLHSQLATQEQATKAQAEAERQAADKLKVIDVISERFKLTEFETKTLSLFDNPMAMETYAKDAQENRRQQTAAAREAKRKELESNPALKVTEGGDSARAEKKDFQDIDELIDSLW